MTGNDDVMGKTRIVDLATGRSRRPPSNDTAPRKTKKAVEAVSRPLLKKTATKKNCEEIHEQKSLESGCGYRQVCNCEENDTATCEKGCEEAIPFLNSLLGIPANSGMSDALERMTPCVLSFPLRRA